MRVGDRRTATEAPTDRLSHGSVISVRLSRGLIMKRFRMPRRQKMFAVLPTMLTLGNAVCGFGAITFAAKVGLAPSGWAGGAPTPTVCGSPPC